jgi:hypothetical protein
VTVCYTGSMACQVKVGTSVQWGRRTVLERPVLAGLLGCLAAQWAVLENEVVQLYGRLMSAYLPRTEGLQIGSHPVALQVFDTLETTHLRLELLTKLGAWVLKSEPLEAELDSIVPAIRRAAKLRNKFVHALWGVAIEYPDALIHLPIFGHQTAYSQADFDDAIDRIIDAQTKLLDFRAKLR